MRMLGRVTLLLLIALPLSVLTYQAWGSLRWNTLAAVLGLRIENAIPSTSYLPVNSGWLEFNLSGTGQALRVRTNGVVDAHVEHLPRIEWWYAFEYQMLDANGQLMRQGEYHHRTRLTRRRNPDTGRLESQNILLDPDVNPTDGRSMVIHFSTAQSPARVRIRPTVKDPALRALMFRVYEQVPNPQHELGYLWQRLGQSKKNRLAQGSVYGLDLLLEEEKQNLLRYDWKAVGPLGVENEQYELTKLYLARGPKGESLDESPIPYGLYCDRIVRGMIPLPPGDWEITLEVVNADQSDAEKPEMTIRWYGRGITERWQTHAPSTSATFRLDRKFNGGQLEIVAPAPMVVRAWGTNGDTRLELTPTPLHVRTYLVDATGSLAVDIDHVAEQSTPFRVDIRARLQPSQDAMTRTLSYELLDADGTAIGSGQLAAPLTLSNYDRLATADSGFNLSEPVRYYFNLSPSVAQLRFSSQPELLLTTYTRPPALPRKVRVPEDYQAFGDDQQKQPAWFLLRPVAEAQLRREFRSNILVVQRRPPETDARLLSGDFDWQLYEPAGNWRARHLLIPRTEGLPVRARSLAAVYREFDANKPQQVTFRGSPGRHEINPDVLYLRDEASPLDVQVMLDGEPYTSIQIAGRQGRFQLPPILPGSKAKALTFVATEPARWFINHAEAKAPSFLRRLAMQLTNSGLEFEYDKQTSGPEILLGQLYTGAATRPELQVVIAGERRQGNGPWQEWTFLKRRFDLTQEIQAPIPVLNSAMKSLHGGQRFFLPLGADLPPGKYRISFTLAGAPDAYLTLYRLIAGQSEFRTLFREEAYAPTLAL